MAITFLWNLQNLWPFSTFKQPNSLKSSQQLVSKLNIPNQTKQFVFAFHDPNSQSLIYILSSLNLSERSSSDAITLINEIKPDAVIVQSGGSVSPFEDDDKDDILVPTSSFGVIKRCFVDKIGRDRYETVAGDFVLKEIFGTGFYGPVLAAKKAAKFVGSEFILVQSPLGNSCFSSNNNNNEKHGSSDNNSSAIVDAGNRFITIVNSLVPQQQVASIGLKRFSMNKDVRMVLAEGLSSYMDPLLIGSTKNESVSEVGSVEIQPKTSYDTPAFAKSIYPLLEDLHDMFSDLPSMGKALGHVQKMLLDVNRGEVLDAKIVSEVYTFRIAVEGLRIALNNRGMRSIVDKGVSKASKVEFSELPVDDKSQVLFAQAIRSQTDKFKTIVAVVDASALAGIRKHWDTPLPDDVKEIVGGLITDSDGKGVSLNHGDRKRLIADRPVVAVGAGATAVLGASSLTKVVPVSTLTKVVSFKIPTSLKIILSQMQKVLSVSLGPSNTSGFMKAAASAEKIRAVTHGVIYSAEKTSVSAMRAAFYEIMRKRKIQRVGFLPWATFAGSIGTCTGLLLYGDGIECAVESLPAAPSIASLGRGIQNLREASQQNQRINSHNPFIKTTFQRFHFHFTPSKLIHRTKQRTVVSCSNTQQDIKETHNKLSKTKINALSDLDDDVELEQHLSGNWPSWKNLPLRYKLIGTTSLAFVICNMDKVNLSIAIIPMSHQFGWNSSTAGLVQSSFFWGYALSQLPGGWLAKIFGGRNVLVVGVLIWSVATALVPFLAGYMPGLILTRILVGIGEGVSPSAATDLIARSIPLEERSRAVAFVFGGLSVGSVLGLLFAPPLIQSIGWESVFYIFGLLGIAWFIGFQFLEEGETRLAAESFSPAQGNMTQSWQTSLKEMNSSLKDVPWKAFFQSRAVWAMIYAHFCGSWGHYTCLSWLPTYFSQELDLNLTEAAWVSILPPLASIFVTSIASQLADSLISKGVETTTVRKICQSIAFLSPALCMTLASLDLGLPPWEMVGLLTGGLALSSFALSGLYCTHQDISPEYASILLGITNTVGAVPGIVGVALTGYLLDMTHSWSISLYAPSIFFYLSGTAVWLVFASSKPQSFSEEN